MNEVLSDKIKTLSLWKFLGVLSTCISTLMLCYGLLWNPYSLYFDRPEFSKVYLRLRENYCAFLSFVNLVILIGLAVIMIIRFWKANRLFLLAPAFVVLTFIVIRHVQTYYPDAESEYTKDGYRYLEQSWYLGRNKTFKRFKSDKPFDSNTDSRTIVWRLDSVGKTE